MVKLVLLFRRRRDVTEEEFLRYWREVHVPLVQRIPGIRRYVISPVIRSPDDADPAHHGMAELWFDDEQSLATALASQQTAVTALDARRFIERGSIRRLVCLEEDWTP